MLLQHYLDGWAARQPGAEFAADGQRSVSYEQALAVANRIAHGLLAAGLGHGDRVATLTRNRIEYVLFCFGAAKAGVVAVPLNCQLDPAQWNTLMDDARPRAVIVESEFVDQVDPIVRGKDHIAQRIVFDGDRRPAGWLDFNGWIGDRSASAPPTVSKESDPVFQIYTSGTTGMPKGVVLSHSAVVANITQIDSVMRYRPGERSLVTLPLFHAAILPTTLAPLARGGSVYVLARFKPSDVIHALNDEKIVVATLVPTMIGACIDAAANAVFRPSHLRSLYYGASPISVDLLRKAMELFKCDFIQSYGLTEAAQAVTFLGPEEHRQALRGHAHLLESAGRAAPGTDIRIAGAGETAGAPQIAGEILVRGPQLMDGYWNQPNQTKKALADGWLRTGDAGIVDSDGYLYIKDRLKDIIISGGENVSSKAVEDVLRGHPAVRDAAVIGVPDDRWGEAVKGIVVLEPESACSAGELLDYCRGKLSSSQRPRSIDFVVSMPLSATGKIRKDVLRERYRASGGRPIG